MGGPLINIYLYFDFKTDRITRDTLLGGTHCLLRYGASFDAISRYLKAYKPQALVCYQRSIIGFWIGAGLLYNCFFQDLLRSYSLVMPRILLDYSWKDFMKEKSDMLCVARLMLECLI